MVPWIFGIMHPTGFPLFTMLAGAFVHLFPGGEVSWRIALFSALTMSAAAWLVFRIAADLSGNVLASMGTAWMFAFGEVVWTRGTRPEVHDLALLFILLALRFALLWYRSGLWWSVPAAALSYGFGMATHAIVVCITPALLLLVLARYRDLRLRQIGIAALALLFAACTFAYLPIRSAMIDSAHLDPTLALGKPAGNAFWDTDDPSSWAGFVRLVTGADFPTGDALRSMFDPQVYQTNGPSLVHDLYNSTFIGIILAIVGLVALLRREWVVAVALLLVGFVPSAFAFGYTVVADMDRYFFSSLAASAILAGVGAAQAARWRFRFAPALAVLPALIACGLLWLNRDTFSQRDDTGARDLLSAAARLTPPNAILIAPWQQATALAYGAYVSGELAHRVVDSSWFGDDAQYVPAWVRTHPVYVVGSPWGSVKGYDLKRVSKDPEVYRVVKHS